MIKRIDYDGCEHVNGKYVCFSDVEHLQQQNDKLTADNAALVEAFNDQLNDCINFNGSILTEGIMARSSAVLKRVKGGCMLEAKLLEKVTVNGKHYTLAEVLALEADNQALRNELEALKASQNKIKADAICDLADNYVNGPITAELTVEYIYEYANKLGAGK